VGIPIGWRFYLNCSFGAEQTVLQSSGAQCYRLFKGLESSDCRAPAWLGKYDHAPARIWSTRINDPLGAIRWIVAVIISGVLISLGAA